MMQYMHHFSLPLFPMFPHQCYGCNTKSTLVSPVTPVMSPDLTLYSGSSS